MKFSKKVLGNGLTIIEVPSNDAESVVVDFFVKTGSRSETPHENGISHFLEHFLFKGTNKYPSALAITELIDSIGAEMNANTGKEHTQYYIKAHSKHLDTIFGVLTDMLQQPLLDAEELEREKGVIVEELNMYRDMPMAEIENILENTMWPREALGQNIVGSKDTVMKFTPAMFRDYMDRHYQMPNMILGVSGRFDQKKLNQLITKHWANLKRRKFHQWDKAKDGQKQQRIIVQYKDTEQAHLSFGFKGLPFKDKRNPAALMLGTILGGGMSSRLFTEIRERRGLAYYVRASSSNYQDTGVFNIGSGVQVNKIHDAITVIMSELQRISRVPVDPKELLKAKEYLKGRTTLALEDNQARLDWCIEQQAFLGKIQTPHDLFKKIDRITAHDVQMVAKDFFKLSRLNLAIIGPYKSDAQFKKLLKF
jgi:predicted Zn-dependent peptidase